MTARRSKRRGKSGHSRKSSSAFDSPNKHKRKSSSALTLSDRQVQLVAMLLQQSDTDWQQQLSNDDQQVCKDLQAQGWLDVSADGWKIATAHQLLTGTVSLHPDGYGFMSTAQQQEDVYLSRREVDDVMPGDQIIINRLHDKKRDRYSGELLGIIQRAHNKLVGRIVESGRRLLLLADDPSISESFSIKNAKGEFSPGSMVVARITRYPMNGKAGRVVIERQLDDQPLAGMATEIAIVSHDLPHQFSTQVNKQTERFGDSVQSDQYADRKDLREMPLVTIDGEDARDFDDAVYANATANGWRLVVAIADVSSYVKPGSALDEEALARGTSVYFPTRVVPMLPEALSNGLCSLRPNVDRLALVCDMQLSKTGEIEHSQFYPVVMRSHARLTYRQANDLLEKPEDNKLEVSAIVKDSLLALAEIWRCRDQVRTQRGALAFERQESTFIWNTDGSVNAIRTTQRLLTHRLIEEAMIAANVEAAKFLLKQKMPAVLRVHPAPSGDKLAELEQWLLMYNLKPSWHDIPTPQDFAQILQQAKQRPDQSVIEEALLRAQSLAIYKPIEEGKTSGHFALALAAYSHFTSPIRRYPDLLVHRAIYQALSDKNSTNQLAEENTQAKLAQLAQHCSLTERRAEQASRDVEFRLKCHYLEAFVGEVFPGWVTGVKNFGLFVELENLHISGLLHVSNLGKDYYVYDERNLCLYNRRSGQRFSMGDHLNVCLLRVDIEQRKIDFSLE